MNNYVIENNRVIYECGCSFDIVDNKVVFICDLQRADHTVNFECPYTYEILSKGLTQGIFQLSSPLGTQWTMKVKPENLEHLSALGAILRPGCIECVSGDTKISLKRYERENRKFHTKKITIKELYDTFKNQHFNYENCIVSYNEDTQEFLHNKILDVFYKGKQDIYKVNIRVRRFGQENIRFYNLKCTLNHRLLVHNKGWLKLSELQIGDRVAVINNLERDKECTKFAPGEKTFNNLCFYNYEYRCVLCDWKESSLDVNHLVGNRKTNNEIDNLCFLCPNHHRMYHENKISKEEIIQKREIYRLKNTRYVYWAEFNGTEFIGNEDVYDISVEDPHNNYIAGNFIVHNSKDEEGISTTIHYERRKNGKEDVSSYHPVVDEVLKDTYNVLCYQEQAMEISVKCAGFNLQEADSLRKCVTDDTMFVSKTRGWISIKELLETEYINDLFLVMDDNGKQSWKNISNIWCTGRHNVIKVETQSGLFVKSTQYHQFLTNTGWKARMRLGKEDFLVSAREIDFDGYDLLSKNLCMIIAGLVTEGYFIENKGSHFTNYDINMMKTFVDNYESYFGHLPSISPDGKVAKISKNDKVIINKYLCYAKSKNKKLPQEMMQTTKETCREFLSFMLSAEGGVTKKTGQFEYSSQSYKLVCQIQLLLKRFGIYSWINSHKTGYKNDNNEYMDCGIGYRLYVNDIRDQKILLSELTKYWPKYKIDDLSNSLNGRNELGYTNHLIPNNIITKLLNQYPFLGNGEGGSIYTSDISHERFGRLCDKSKDKKWIEFSRGKQLYDSIKDMSTVIKEVLTYDFSIADESTPFIIANGLIIHNSIGKKLPEDMAKSKKLFLEKAAEFGVLNEDQAIEVFNWIEASQRYSFNLSHAMCYGVTGYQSAFIKAHMPVYFYKNWLKHEKREDYLGLVNEAKLFDINVYPPNIQHWKQNFYAKGQNIYFGLSDVKGILKKDIQLIGETLDSLAWKAAYLGESIGWVEFLANILDRVSSKTAEGLIHSGALDCFAKDRAVLSYEYERWNRLSPGEKKLVGNRQFDSVKNLIEHIKCIYETKYASAIADFDGKKLRRETSGRTYKTALEPPNPSKRLAIIAEILSELTEGLYTIQDTVDSVIFAEENLLGVTLSRHKIDEIPNCAETATCLEIANGRRGYSTLRVKVEHTKAYKCKRGDSAGKEMCFLELSDKSARINNVVAFPGVYAEFGHLLVKGNVVFVSGELDKESFILKRVYSV